MPMTMRSTRWMLALAALAGAAAGCGDDSEPLDASGASGGGGGASPAPSAVANLAVDADRDGIADPESPEDEASETAWTATHGASFLANLDDDDGDGAADFAAPAVEAGDEADLAPVTIAPWPEAPLGATGKLTIVGAGVQNARVWKRRPDGGWDPLLGVTGSCEAETASACAAVAEAPLTTEEVRAGLALGVEGKRFRVGPDDPWDGNLTLRYALIDAAGAPATGPEGAPAIDEARLRIAPWVLFGNLSEIDTVYSNDVSKVFMHGISRATKAGGVEYRKIHDYWDHWTQDNFQTGWTAIPGPGGSVHGMRVAMPRSWHPASPKGDQHLPLAWLKKSYLGADRGVFRVHLEDHRGSTYDSFGNHDLIPAYEKDGQAFPLGRIIYGTPEGVLDEFEHFYDAQGVQAPALAVDTSWLYVGHVDEVFSYVPAATSRGFKLLVGSPRMAREMLEDAQQAGHGAVKLFVGKTGYNGFDNPIPAERTIDEVLADEDLMAWSQESQVEIDSMVEIVAAELGLSDDEIIPVPYLFEKVYGEGMLAYNPGTANLLAFGDHVVHADPFGPKIDGVDIFRKDLEVRLGTPLLGLGSSGQGLEIFFTDDWDDYHVLFGEVHCGSNIDGPPPFADARWWEVAR